MSGECLCWLCIASVLKCYEYLQKLFGQWQEGASAEVVITDIDPSAFDHFLTYVHNGTVDCQLELEALVELISLANKYLMHDLVASCLLCILSILQDADRMKQQKIELALRVLAWLLSIELAVGIQEPRIPRLEIQ